MSFLCIQYWYYMAGIIGAIVAFLTLFFLICSDILQRLQIQHNVRYGFLPDIRIDSSSIKGQITSIKIINK